MSFPSLHQLQTPLLACQDNEVAMARQQPRQLGCDDENEHHVPDHDGIFRVIHQQQDNELILLDENSIDDRDGNVVAAEISPQPQQQWYQQPQQLSAMISNFSTSYNAVNVSLVLPILKVAMHRSSTIIDEIGDETSSSSVSQQHASSLEADAEAAVASSLLAGMMLGQILGGVLGDLVGPSLALRLVMFLQIIASIGSSCSDLQSSQSMSSSSSLTIYWHLAAWRFILGIGAGGVYPLAAVLSASTNIKQQDDVHCHTKVNVSNDVCDTNTDNHQMDENNKLHRVVLTFSTQGLGFITVPLIAVILLHSLPNNLDVVWRLMLGFGSIPGIVLLVWQWRTPQSQNDCQTLPLQEERESLNVTETVIADLDVDDTHGGDSDGTENGSVLCSLPDVDQANENSDESPYRSPPHNAFPVAQSSETKSLWESIRNEEDLVRKLLGTAATWFLFDVLFYGNTLFQPIVMEAAFGTSANGDPVHLLQQTARNSLILTSIALPGYIVASAVLGKSSVWCYCGIEQTPRFVMMQGFGVMAVLYFTIGSAWETLRRFPSVLVVLYRYGHVLCM